MTRTFFILILIYAFFVQDINSQQNNLNINKTIKIGLLINNDRSFQARNGAELAVSMANIKAGPDTPIFKLEARSMEGPWGTGSNEAVNLIFKENVWAILGSHNGRNAHLVEQVIAKTGIVFVSAWASDPTLSKAFVPWYFNCVPNDLQRAETLIEEIYRKRNFSKIAVVSDSGYDSKLALESFLKNLKISGETEPVQLFYKNSDTDFHVLLDKINKERVEGILLFGRPLGSLKIIEQLRQRKMNQPVFGTLSLIGESEVAQDELVKFEEVIIVNSVNWLQQKGIDFKKEFQKKYDKDPTDVAAYAFDGMNLIIDAIRVSGFDRDKVRENMSKLYYKGVTGNFRFDEKGNRIGFTEQKNLKNGILVSDNK